MNDGMAAYLAAELPYRQIRPAYGVAVTPGKFRSVTDFPPLFAKAGLRLKEVVHVSESVSLLEGVAA